MFNWFYIEGILILVGVNLMVVLGLSLLTGFTGLFSFGHAGFMAIGAYVSAVCTLYYHLPFITAMVLGAAAAMVMALIIGYFTLGLKGDYFCIATLGFGESVRLIFDNLDFFGGARGISSIPMITTFELTLVICTLAVAALTLLMHSRHGRNMIAIREEELASQAIGIHVFRYKMISFAISAAYAAVGGALYAHYLGYLQPLMFQLTKSTEMTIMVIFGGLGSIGGSVIGAVLLTFLPELLRSFANWRLVFYGAAVVLIMISRPQGLMGGMELTDLWRKLRAGGWKRGNTDALPDEKKEGGNAA